MWTIFGIGASLCFAVTAYIDEYLTSHNAALSERSIHTRIGPVIVTSLVSNLLGAVAIYFFSSSIELKTSLTIYAFLTGIPTMLVLIVYLYLLDSYSVPFVVPLFQLTSIWLLLFSFLMGEPITLLGCFGVIFIVAGAYAIDATKSAFKLPSRLLVVMAVNTLVWAVTLVSMTYLAKEAGGMLPIVFWQNVCAVLFGLVLYFCVSDYRKGLRMRILNQKRLFLSLSAVNEVFSQMGYVFKYMALAYAPVIAYGNTLSSLESGLVLIAFFLYPIRNESIKIHHVLGVVCIIIGVAFVDFSLPRGLFG